MLKHCKEEKEMKNVHCTVKCVHNNLDVSRKSVKKAPKTEIQKTICFVDLVEWQPARKTRAKKNSSALRLSIDKI